MDIKAYSPNKRVELAETLPQTFKPLIRGLIAMPKMALQPLQAQAEGTNLVTACKTKEFRVYFLGRLMQMSDRVDCTRRFTTTEEYIDCVEEILAAVPALTVEEVELVFRKFERGDIETYGRLKTPDILKALLEYDGTTACDVRERRHTMDLPQGDRLSQRPDKEFLSLTQEDLLNIAAVGKQKTNPNQEN